MFQQDSYQSSLLEQQIININRTQKPVEKWGDIVSKPSIWLNYHQSSQQSNVFSDPNRHRFNHYADKQLYHLVLSQEFDFSKIAEILNYIFRDERARYTETSCRERWEELYNLRQNQNEVKQKRMEDKRASSVSVFNDPFSLYNLEEMVEKLERTEKQNSKNLSNGVNKLEGNGYNIFKNSIRHIDDIQGYKKRQKEMINALNLAKDPSHTITDKFMHFSPYYERLAEFQVKEEELTQEKMKEIMSVPIQIESLEKQLRPRDMNESAQDWKNKRSKRQQQKIEAQGHQYEIEQNWDEYESD